MKRFFLFGSVLLVLNLFMATLLLQGCSESPTKTKKPVVTQRKSTAELEFEKAANRPPSAKTLYALAKILTVQGKDPQAEVVLKRIINENPKFSPARNSLAEMLMRQRRIDEAIKTLSEGLKLNKRDPVLLNNLAMCWLVRRDYDKALDIFTIAAGIDPENSRYRANMAVVLAFMGRDEEALSLYKQILPEEQAIHNLNIVREHKR